MDQKSKNNLKTIGKKILIATGVCLGVKLIFTAGNIYGTIHTVEYCKYKLDFDILAEMAKQEAK